MSLASLDFAPSLSDEGINFVDPATYAPAVAAAPHTHEMHAAVYRSHVLYELEDYLLWTRQWVCVGHVAQIPEPWDLLPFTIGFHGLHVQRMPNNSLRARFNKAQHGGCRSVPAQCRTGTRTDCPYTACGFSRDRDVIRGVDGRDNLELSYQYLGVNPDKLFTAQVLTWSGFVFVHVDPRAEVPAWGDHETSDESQAIPHTMRPLAWVEVAANWKLLGRCFIDPDGACTRSHDNGVFPDRDRRRAWVFPNLLLEWQDDALIYRVLQPISPTSTCERSGVLIGVDQSAELSNTQRHLAADRDKAVGYQSGIGHFHTINVAGTPRSLAGPPPQLKTAAVATFQRYYASLMTDLPANQPQSAGGRT